MTVLDLIKGAMRLIRVLGDGETPSGTMGADALQTMKMMLDEWGNEDLMMYQKNTSLFSLVPAASSYTIGEGFTVSTVVGNFLVGQYVKGATSAAIGYLAEKDGSIYTIQAYSGTFVTGETINQYNLNAATIDSTVHAVLSVVPTWQAHRPKQIDSAFVRVGTEDYNVCIDSNEDYNNIYDKSTASDYVTHISYFPQFPNGKVYVYPVPTVAASLMLNYKKHFSEINNVSDQIVLPHGYEKAIKYNLALELAPEYGKVPDQIVIDFARESKGWIKRANNDSIECGFDAAITSQSGYSDIITG